MAEPRRFRLLQPTGGPRLARAGWSLVTAASLAFHMILGCCCQHAHCGGAEPPHHVASACGAHDAPHGHDHGDEHDVAPADGPHHESPHESQHCAAGGCVFLPAAQTAVDAAPPVPTAFLLARAVDAAVSGGTPPGLPIARGLPPPPGPVPLFLAQETLLI